MGNWTVPKMNGAYSRMVDHEPFLLILALYSYPITLAP